MLFAIPNKTKFAYCVCFLLWFDLLRIPSRFWDPETDRVQMNSVACVTKQKLPRYIPFQVCVALPRT